MKNFQKQLAKQYAQTPWEKPVRLWNWEKLITADFTPKKLSKIELNKNIVQNTDSFKNPQYKIANVDEIPTKTQKQILHLLTQYGQFSKLDCFALSKSKSIFVIDIPSNTQISIDYFSDCNDTFPVIIWRLGKNAKVLINEIFSKPKLDSMQAYSHFFILEDNAHLDFLSKNISVSGNSHLQQSMYQAFLSEKAICNFYISQQNTSYQHLTVLSHHLKDDSNSDMFYALIGSLQTRSYTQLLNHHVGKNTQGDMHVKGIGRDSALCTIDGLIKIEKKAEFTSSFLKEDILLLSENAQMKTVPNLEILNNEVHCSHSATFGNIDANKLFYLESRGLSQQQASELIISAFFSSMRKNIKEPRIRNMFPW